MGYVGGADVDGVEFDGLIRQHFFVIGVHLRAGDAVFPGGLFRAFGDDVAEGDHFNVWKFS